jgi:hypothetical protein
MGEGGGQGKHLFATPLLISVPVAVAPFEGAAAAGSFSFHHTNNTENYHV